LARLNMPHSRSAGGLASNQGLNKKAATEKPDWEGCYQSPKHLEAQFAGAAKSGQAHAHEDILMYTCGDENRGPIADMCFCKASLAEFRDWLKATQYADIAALNAEWGTAYKSFDEVMPM